LHLVALEVRDRAVIGEGEHSLVRSPWSVVRGIWPIAIRHDHQYSGQWCFDYGLLTTDSSVRSFSMSSPGSSNITSVLKETRVFPPPQEFAARAHVKSMTEYESLWQQAKDNPEAFWSKQAESLHWFKRWDKVLVWNEPQA